MPYDFITKVCPICGTTYSTVAGEAMPFCLGCLNDGDSPRVKAYMARRQMIFRPIIQYAQRARIGINLFKRR